MKKVLIFFGTIIISTLAFCQLSRVEGKETRKSKIRLGIKAGFSVADLKTEYGPAVFAVDQAFKFGGVAGVFFQMPVGEATSFHPELLLVVKGTKQKGASSSAGTRLTYLELPLNLLYKPVNPKGSFFIGGGPAPAYYIGENLFYTGYNEFKKFDVGINILTGYELPIGFSFNLCYTHGIVNISQNRTDFPVIKNQCFGFSFGYTF